MSSTSEAVRRSWATRRKKYGDRGAARYAGKPLAGDAVDPQADSTGKPTTRDTQSSNSDAKADQR